jgi:hypothetical protein
MPPQPLMIDGFAVQDDWSYAASSNPVSSFDHANVDWQQLSEQPESAMSRSVLAGIACNQRHVGLAPQHWQHSMYQVLHLDHCYSMLSCRVLQEPALCQCNVHPCGHGTKPPSGGSAEIQAIAHSCSRIK